MRPPISDMPTENTNTDVSLGQDFFLQIYDIKLVQTSAQGTILKLHTDTGNKEFLNEIILSCDIIDSHLVKIVFSVNSCCVALATPKSMTLGTG